MLLSTRTCRRSHALPRAAGAARMDRRSLKILKAIHTASKAGAELVLAEAVIPDPGVEDPVGTPAKFIDAVMLCVGGMERSRSEWVMLLSKAGWKLDKLVPTMGPNCQMIFCIKA